jgi:hypothetical protein
MRQSGAVVLQNDAGNLPSKLLMFNDKVVRAFSDPTEPGSVPEKPLPSQKNCVSLGNLSADHVSGKVPVRAQKLQLYLIQFETQ